MDLSPLRNSSANVRDEGRVERLQQAIADRMARNPNDPTIQSLRVELQRRIDTYGE